MDEGPLRILVAGIGGASLGTEIIKSLLLAGGYSVFGCDISPLAFGHYVAGMAKTFLIRESAYESEVLTICRQHRIQAVIAGGEVPMRLLRSMADALNSLGVHLAGNRNEVVALCSDKGLLFEELQRRGVPIPRTRTVADQDQLEAAEGFPMPCVVKPATGSGGSAFTGLASSWSEARQQGLLILGNGAAAVLQEYISDEEGEFTVGVLALPECGFTGSIALRRALQSKLSVASRTSQGVISSGYSQGLVEDHPGLRRQAEQMAVLLGCDGPLNIQGRVRGGVLYPFEINPRFSATTYLRTLAGFNEIDLYLKYKLKQQFPSPPQIIEGYYLRSLTETYVPKDRLRT